MFPGADILAETHSQRQAVFKAEAVLRYIGIGVGSDSYSWGNMINLARQELSRDPVVWWPLLSAFLMMFLLVISVNILGDRVRDALDSHFENR